MFEQQELSEIFSKFSGKKVLIIGDVMIDSYLWGRVERISPEAPVPVVSLIRRESRPGGAANVALNIQAMGATAILCSVIGSDAHSAEFVALLEANNLTADAIVKSKDRITTTKFRIIGNNAHMLRVDEETDRLLTNQETERLLRVIQNQLDQGVDAIIFEDYDKGVITEKLIQKVAALAKAKKIPVTADPKKRNFNLYKNITLFKPNLKELREGLKLDHNPIDHKELDAILFPFMKEQGLELAIVTLSEAGVYIGCIDHYKNRNSDVIPAHIRNIADVSGAGDTVIAVATLCLAAKVAPLKMAVLANLAGGLVCEDVGVVPINKEKLFAEAVSKFGRGV